MSETKNAAPGTKNAATGTKIAATGTKNAAPGTKNAAPGTKNAAPGTKIAATGTKNIRLRLFFLVFITGLILSTFILGFISINEEKCDNDNIIQGNIKMNLLYGIGVGITTMLLIITLPFFQPCNFTKRQTIITICLSLILLIVFILAIIARSQRECFMINTNSSEKSNGIITEGTLHEIIIAIIGIAISSIFIIVIFYFMYKPGHYQNIMKKL